MFKIKGFCLYIPFALTAGVYSANAMASDSYNQATFAACEHLKNCAKDNMQDIPPQYREMIEQSLSSMCQSLPSATSIPGFGPDHQMYGPALACMKSITALSCAEIDKSGASTPECDRLSNM